MARSKRHIPRRVSKNAYVGKAPNTKKYRAALKEYRKLAKRADQRLLRIERYAQRPEYENITQYAYARAMRDIRAWSGENAKRFNTTPPTKTQSLLAKINDIKYFLQAATSSIKPTQDNAVYREVNGVKTLVGGGVDLTYAKRAATLNKEYGTDVTWENVGWMFESALYRNLAKSVGDSKTAVRIIGQIQKNEKKILNAYKKGETYNVRIKGQKPLEEEVNAALAKYETSVKSLYKLLK